jgi:hypothetical protein
MTRADEGETTDASEQNFFDSSFDPLNGDLPLAAHYYNSTVHRESIKSVQNSPPHIR